MEQKTNLEWSDARQTLQILFGPAQGGAGFSLTSSSFHVFLLVFNVLNVPEEFRHGVRPLAVLFVPFLVSVVLIEQPVQIVRLRFAGFLALVQERRQNVQVVLTWGRKEPLSIKLQKSLLWCVLNFIILTVHFRGADCGWSQMAILT